MNMTIDEDEFSSVPAIPPEEGGIDEPAGNYDEEDPDDEEGGMVSSVPCRRDMQDDRGYSMLDQPMYDNPQNQLINDIAKDESYPALYNFILGAEMGIKAKMRLMTRAAAFQSKNQVFSNIENTRDFQMIQDDFELVRKFARLDFTSYDLTADYFTADSIMEAMHNIRLRRSRRALNLRQVNTQRSESVMEQQALEESEDKRLGRKVPLIGSYL